MSSRADKAGWGCPGVQQVSPTVGPAVLSAVRQGAAGAPTHARCGGEQQQRRLGPAPPSGKPGVRGRARRTGGGRACVHEEQPPGQHARAPSTRRRRPRTSTRRRCPQASARRRCPRTSTRPSSCWQGARRPRWTRSPRTRSASTRPTGTSKGDGGAGGNDAWVPTQRALAALRWPRQRVRWTWGSVPKGQMHVQWPGGRRRCEEALASSG